MAAKTPRERGFGQWLIDQRVQRGWRTAEMARREMLRLGGIKVDKSTYASYESGAIRPRPERQREFATFYGSEPPSEGAPETTELGALVAKLSDLVDELRLTRQEQAEWNKGVQDSLALLAQRLPAPGPTNGPALAPLEGARP